MLSARVSHLHLRIDKSDVVTKTKSSGLCVSTGTGSTSWLTSMNRLSTNNVKDLIEIIKRRSKSSALEGIDPAAVSEEYNQNLVYPPDDPRLCYSIREQICVGVWPNPKGLESRGFAKQITVKSRCIDASELITVLTRITQYSGLVSGLVSETLSLFQRQSVKSIKLIF